MILRRYLMRQVATTTILVVGFLLALMLGGRLVRYFGLAVEGGLDVGLIFTIIGYNIPFLLELILPLSFFIALMLVFGRLYVDHEMDVINGSGISRGGVARLMMPLFVFLLIVESVLSLDMAAWGSRKTGQIWYEQGLKTVFDLVRPHEFFSSGNYHLYVGGISPDKKALQDIILIQTARPLNENITAENTKNSLHQPSEPDSQANQDDQNLGLPQPTQGRDTVILAKKAQQVEVEKASGTVQLDLYQGRRYEIGADNLQYNQISFERYRLSLSQPMEQDEPKVAVDAQPFYQVWQTAISSHKYSNSQEGNDVAEAKAELGYRLALPWLMIIAPMLAVPLAQVKPRQGRWLKLFPAILMFVSCALVIISLKNPISKGKLSVWSYVWVILAFLALALHLNWRSRLYQHLRIRRWQKQLSHGRSSNQHHD